MAPIRLASALRGGEYDSWPTCGTLRGVKKLDFKFTLTMAAYDLIKRRGCLELRLE
jgi:hypothetical protein